MSPNMSGSRLPNLALCLRFPTLIPVFPLQNRILRPLEPPPNPTRPIPNTEPQEIRAHHQVEGAAAQLGPVLLHVPPELPHLRPERGDARVWKSNMAHPPKGLALLYERS